MSTQTAEKAAAREIWLHYFNRYLYERGVITEREYRKMRLRIESECDKHGMVKSAKGLSGD